METIKTAEQSPRISNDGSIRWYEGDTFEIEFNFKFTDSEQNIIAVGTNDTIEMEIYNFYNNNSLYLIKAIGTNKLIFKLDEETTKIFSKGTYYYKAKRNAQFITTIMNNNLMVVE